jgi:hypothetical protein
MGKLDLYCLHQAEINTGDIVEFRGNSLVGRAIRWVTGKDRNHSALVIRMPFAGCVERRFIVEAIATGLELHLLSSVLEKFDGAAWWSPLLATDEQRDSIAGWAMVQIAENRGYDYGSLFRQAVARVSLDGRRYFCSEFVQAAMIKAAIVPEPTDGKALRPGEFDKLGCFGAPVLVCE